MVVLYGLGSCDSCRRALKALNEAGVEAHFEDLRGEAIDLEACVERWLEAVGGEVLVNRRSTTWRGLSGEDRDRADQDPTAVLSAHPTLIKRPVIEARGRCHVGWTPATRAALGL